MTTFWAGPCCTHFLAMLGAEVIHVESTRRPDGTRLIAGMPVTEDQWWEKSPIFVALNTNKKGLTLDLQSPRGRELLRRLIATCDVIVENFTPRVLDQIGLDFAAVQAIRPRRGYAANARIRPRRAVARQSGVRVRHRVRGRPELADRLSRPPALSSRIRSVIPTRACMRSTALLLALEHRRRTGEGVLVEAAMVDAALSISAEQIIEYSAYGALLERAGNRGPTAAPQNLYRCADIDEFGRLDSWVAIAVATDDQWRRPVRCARITLLGNGSDADRRWPGAERTTI